MRPEEFGKEHGLIQEAVVTGRRVGAGKEFWANLAHNTDLFRIAQYAVEDAIALTAPRPTFTVKVNYELTRTEMLVAARCHHGNIFEKYNFTAWQPGRGVEEVTMELFLFIKERVIKDMDAKLDEMGYQCSNLAQTLALLAAYPDDIWDLCSKFGGKKILVAGTIVDVMYIPVIQQLATSDEEYWKDTYFWLTEILALEVYFIPAVRKPR